MKLNIWKNWHIRSPIKMPVALGIAHSCGCGGARAREWWGGRRVLAGAHAQGGSRNCISALSCHCSLHCSDSWALTKRWLHSPCLCYSNCPLLPRVSLAALMLKAPRGADIGRQATKVTKEKTCALGKTLLSLGLSKQNSNKASRISKSFCYRQLEIATAPPPVPGTCLPEGSGSGSPSRWPVCPWGKAKQVPHK